AKSRHCAPQQKKTTLFDHFVGAGVQRWWDRETERLCCFAIDYELVLGRCLHRKVGRLLTLEDAINIPRRAADLLINFFLATPPISRSMHSQIEQSQSRCESELAVKIRPSFGELANFAMSCSISRGSRMLIALTSIPTDGATYWITENWPTPTVSPGSRRTATRVTVGAI